MRWDLILCGVLFPLTPIVNAICIRWRLQRHEISLSALQTLALVMGLAILGITLGNILWILIGILSGIGQAIFTSIDINEGLRLGFDRAVPLDENEDLITWGLLPPVLVGLCLNLLAHFIIMAVLTRPKIDTKS